MAKDHRALVEKWTAAGKDWEPIVTLLGGREIHPISVAMGGFYRVPRRRVARTGGRPERMGAGGITRYGQVGGRLRFPGIRAGL